MAEHARPKRRGVAALLISSLMFSGLALEATVSEDTTPASASTCDFEIEPVHGSNLFFNSKANPDFDGLFLGYRVSASVSHTAVAVTTTLTGTNKKGLTLRAAAGQNGDTDTLTRTIGDISAGSSGTAYFFAEVQVLNTSDDPVTATVTISTGSGAQTCAFSETLQRVPKSVIRANANKIFSAEVSSTGTVRRGSTVVVTVTGNTGNVGSGPFGLRDIQLVPVSIVENWAPEAWDLQKVSFKSANAGCNGGAPIVDMLYLSAATSPRSTDCAGVYSANYTFKARTDFTGTQANASEVQAFSYIASGNLIKHTNPYSSVIALPKASETLGTVVTDTEPDLVAVLSAAPIPFTVNDLTMVTNTTNTVTSEALTSFNSVNGINWDTFCIGATISATNPSAQCLTNTSVTIPKANDQSGGIFSIVTMGDGTKRISYNPNNGNVTGETVNAAEVGFRVEDGNGTIAYGIASGEITDQLVANNIYFTAFGQQPSESPAISGSNGTPNTSLTCLIDGANCLRTPVTQPNVGTWQLSSGDTKITFTAASGFSGDASIDFRIQTAAGQPTAFGTATVTVVGAPTVTPASASVSPMADVTLSPSVAVQGTYVKCIYTSGAVPDPCNQTSVTATSVSWTLLPSGIVSFSSQIGFTGLASVVFGIRDTYGQVASASLTVEVLAPANPTITAETENSTTAQLVTLSPTLTASSSYSICLVDAGSCASSLTTAQGSWSVVGEELEFTSVNTFTGNATATARITDLFGQTANATQTVVVAAPAAPSVADVTGVTTTTTPKTVTPAVTSVLPTVGCIEDVATPGSCATGTVTQAGIGSWTTSSGNVTFTADVSFTGTATVSYLITDTLGRTDSATVSIVVNGAGTQLLDAFTVAASQIGTTTATLNGSVDASGVTSNTYFCYDTQPNLASCTLIAASPSTVAGNSSASISLAITGLTAGTEYHFKAVSGDGVSTESGEVLTFSTQVVVQSTPNQPAPAPAPEVIAPESTDPCEPEVELSSQEQELAPYFAETFQIMFSGVAGSLGYGFEALAANNMSLAAASARAFGSNPLTTGVGVVTGATELFFEISFTNKAKNLKVLEPTDVVISSGENFGEIEVSTTDGQPLEVLGVQSIDLELYVEYSGAELNNPLLWQQMGYGMLCWKLEPFTETSFVLPNPIQLPAGTPEGNWVYSNVIVKAGSATTDPTTFQANTLFPKPGPGQAVWADVNGNGIYDPGGKNGDKAISHIKICADLLSDTPSPEPTPIQTPETEPTVDPTPTVSPTPTPTQTSTPTPTPEPTPTQTVAPTPTATPAPSPATPAPALTPTPAATPTPTTTATPTTCASPIPTDNKDKPVISEPTPLPSGSPKAVIRVVPLSTPTPTPTEPGATSSPTPSEPGVTPSPEPEPEIPGVTPSPTPTEPGATPEPTPTQPGVTPSPTPTEPGATPEPTPTQPGVSPTPSPTPSPTEPTTPPGEPEASPSPTPSEPGATPSPTPTEPGTSPEPEPGTPGVTPSPTPTQPGGVVDPTPFFDYSSPEQCVPTLQFSVALKVSNGMSTTCLRVTSGYFSLLAFAPRTEIETEEVSETQEETLADTGANSMELLLWALMLFGAGLVFSLLARRRA